MGKYLLWAVVILGALLVARMITHRAAAKSLAKHKPDSQQPHSGASENMVRCAHCGIHLPQSEAVLIEGRTWCSPEHVRLGMRERP
jgi:uncharacterized protein